MIKKTFFASLTIAVYASLAPQLVFAGPKISTPAGELRNTDLTDLKPHPSASKTYNELWTYHFFFDNNIQAYLNFSRVSLGSFKEPVCGSDLTLLGLKGKNYSVAREYPKENFRFNDSLQQLRVHQKIWFDGILPTTHHVHFETSKKDINYFVDLTFSEIETGKVWGDGMFHFGSSDAIGIFIHIPSAKVTGIIAVNGDTLHVSGKAYMDHTFQTDMAPDLVSDGVRYISQTDPLEVGYILTHVSKFEGKPVGYGLRKTPTGYTLLKPANLRVLTWTKPMGVKVPGKMEIKYEDSSQAMLERKVDRLQQSTLHEFSGFTKMAIRSFMGGEIYTFKGMGKLNGNQPAAYNFFVVD